jgi:adenylate cyclase, class 2
VSVQGDENLRPPLTGGNTVVLPAGRWPYTFAVTTSLETEIKLPVSHLPDLLRRLGQLGARDSGRVFEQNTLYDTPEGDFRGHGRLVRLRSETANGRRTAKLTSKAPVEPKKASRKRVPRHKRRIESEVDVRPAKKTAAMLEAIGLRPSFRYEKFRTSFRLGGLHVDLDETPVGTFLELEGRPGDIDRVARKLGYKRADYICGTYWDVYAAHCRREGRRPRNMLFAHKNQRKHSLSA